MLDQSTIRPLNSAEDYQACVALQREIWGPLFTEAVPASLMRIAQKLGGVALGAFAADGALMGFVFGITGVMDGDLVHWSDLLAVRPEAQNIGLGRRLKERQRQAVARLGVTVIYWTFDPLLSRNAHLNFNVFGATASEYVRDMYGRETGSGFHAGIGTDRLVLAWPVDDAALARRRERVAAARDAIEFRSSPVIGDADRPDLDLAQLNGPTHLRIAIPLDVGAVQQADVTRAAAWRHSTRAAFEAALAAGYEVDGFSIDTEKERGFYLLRLERS